MPRPLAVLGMTYFFCLAILFRFSEMICIIVCLLSLIGFAVTLAIKSFRKTPVFPLAFFALSLACIMVILTNQNVFKPAMEQVGDKVEIYARIIDLPQKSNRKFFYTAQMLNEDGTSKGVKLRFSSKIPLEAEPYDYVKFNGKIYELGSGSEQSKARYKSSGICIGAYTFDEISVIKAESRPFFYHILMLRQRIGNSINSYLPNENGGLITALLLGDTEGLTYETKQSFSQTGIAHLFSVSGLHMSVWVMSVLSFLQLLKVKRRTAAAISIVFIFLLLGFTGFSKPCMRAGFMYLVILVGYIVRRSADAINSAGLAVLLITLKSPMAAMNLGLQLSFLSILGIVVLSEPLSKSLLEKVSTLKFKWIKSAFGAVISSVCVTLSATIFTLPICIVTFKSVSLLSPISNLLTVYPSSFAMILGGIGAITSAFKFLSFVTNPLMLLAGFSSKYVLWCTRKLSEISFASVSANEKYIYLWLAGSLIIFAFAFVFLTHRNKSAMKLTAMICVVSLLTGVLSFNVFNRNVTKITVADNGNGSCVVVTKKSHAMMIACGGDYFAANNAVNILKLNNIKSLDLMIIPRLNETEYNGTFDVLQEIDYKHCVTPKLNNELKFLQLNGEIVESKSVNVKLWNTVHARYESGAQTCYTYLNIDGTTVLILFNSGCDMNKIPKELREADILICRTSPPESIDVSKFSLVIISAQREKSLEVMNEKRMIGVNVSATSGMGNIEINTNGNSVFSVRRQG